MYLYSTSQTLNAHKVTLGNMVSKTFIIMMMLAIFVLPQATVAQRDVDLDQPPSSLDETIVTQQNTQPKPQIIQRNIETTQSLKHSDTVAAGTLSNKIDPTTIWSYAKGGGRGSILCSTIARINLSNLTGLPYRQGGFAEASIARGDAYTLALHGAARGQMIVTNKTSMELDIWAQYDQTHNTIFDVYFYKGSNGGIMQGHRAVVFIGTDDQIYILDPIRGQITSKPQLLANHFAADGYRGYTMYIAKTSYQPKQQYKTIQEYYEIQDSASLVGLVNDGVATVEDMPLGGDTVLTINQDMRFTTDTQEIIIEKGAIITIQSTTNLIGWKLVPEQGGLKAQFAMPEFGTLTPWDR